MSDSARINLRWGALVGLHGAYLAKGDTGRAAAAILTALRIGMEPARMLYVVGLDATGAFRSQCAQLIARMGPPRDTMAARSLWIEGVWASRVGDTARLSAVQGILERRAPKTGDQLDRMLADAMAGRSALVRGDSADAGRRLSALAPVGPPVEIGWRPWEPLAGEWLELARLRLAQGDNEGALRVASVFDHAQPIAYLPYVPASLAIRARAAKALGRPVLTEQFSRRLSALDRSDLLAVQ
jgi:fermentation-respiration switch protein FrsA (DUF1100 family)